MMPPDSPLQASPAVGALESPRSRADPDERSDLWSGDRLGTIVFADLISGTFVWGGIGWLLDRWLATGPWLMALGFVLGNAMGIYGAWLRFDASFAASPTAPRRSRVPAAGAHQAAPRLGPVAADVASPLPPPGADPAATEGAPGGKP